MLESEALPGCDITGFGLAENTCLCQCSYAILNHFLASWAVHDIGQDILQELDNMVVYLFKLQ